MYLRVGVRLFQRSQIRDDVGDLRVGEADLHGALRNRIVFADTERIHERPWLELGRVLDPARQVPGVERIETCGEGRARTDVRQVRPDIAHHRGLPADRVASDAHARRNELGTV